MGSPCLPGVPGLDNITSFRVGDIVHVGVFFYVSKRLSGILPMSPAPGSVGTAIPTTHGTRPRLSKRCRNEAVGSPRRFLSADVGQIVRGCS